MTRTPKFSVCVVGASGRTGSLIPGLLKEYGAKLVGAVVSKESLSLEKVCLSREDNFGEEVLFTSSLEEGGRRADVVIDFSTSSSSEKVLRFLIAHKKPLLLATTGLSAEALTLVNEVAAVAPVLHVANTSLVVCIMQEVVSLAQTMLGDRFDTEIFEIHHRGKKDAPSGTALHLAGVLAAGSGGSVVPSREGSDALRQKGEVGVAALRGGDVPGEHTVFFFGEGERLEITQRARERSVFARGAITLSEQLIGRGPGLYSPKELLFSRNTV